MNPDAIIGKRVFLPGHTQDWVVIENLIPLDEDYFQIQARLPNGVLSEFIVTKEELYRSLEEIKEEISVNDPERLKLIVESSRIRLAYSFDPYFAVSLSGIKTLPHQIEAVYIKMLPQPRLRFLLADDPGAGKTIMAGLLIKELKLRGAVDKILILVPASLTIQWQDELMRFFNEYFVIVDSESDRHQLINPWERENQIIASIDYAKQKDVRERVWQQKWDLVIVDEAHKCSAYTKSYGNRSPEVAKTLRYQLVEKLSQQTHHLLFLTATPHHGDEDRFAHFLRLLDPDVFPEPHKLLQDAHRIRKEILSLGKDCPWAIRRLKEDLRDLNGNRLFTDRHVQTVTFTLNSQEYYLYEKVTEYLNKFLSGGTGKQKQSIALTRTVLQRRLASSTRAIFETLRRRYEKQRKLLEEFENLPPHEILKRLEQKRYADEEVEDDDLDEIEKDRLSEEFTAARHLDELRMEVAALKELVQEARRIYEQVPDSKLNTLKEVLQRAEFQELRDGRGKLLIFTEHKDTLYHLKENLEKWGYKVCEIHGGMNPRERKKAQEVFRTEAQICVATEAAGEGINLQFCHLVINYDLPWNPTRLEQRLGRVHRIGQTKDVYVFNFVAEEAENGKPVIEGKILKRLLDKLDKMRDALGSDRVFDVIGEILSINRVDLANLLREALYNPKRLDEYLDRIEQIDPEKWKKYEEATGIALARAYVKFEDFQKKNFEAEERRLMPEYVERYFRAAAKEVGLRVEDRADGLLRIPYVPKDLRSETLEAVRRFGKPEKEYRKVTFHKEHLEMDQHLDAVLIGPGHPLYACVDEVLNRKFNHIRGGLSVSVDPATSDPYWLHFFEMDVVGDYPQANSVLYSEVVAVKEDKEGMSILPPEIIHDLSVPDKLPETLPKLELDRVINFIRVKRQIQKRQEIYNERKRQAEIIKEYLEKTFDARIWRAQQKVMELKAKVEEEKEFALALSEAEKELEELERLKNDRLNQTERISTVRTGPVRHLASFWVIPYEGFVEISEELKERSEIAAMKIAMDYERSIGWEPEDVSKLKLGFDIRSLSPPDPQTGRREVRRIEVKGRKRREPIRMTVNEWLKAKQLGDTYWLYVVWDPLDENYELVRIQNPASKFELVAKEIKAVSFYEIPANAIEKEGSK